MTDDQDFIGSDHLSASLGAARLFPSYDEMLDINS
jgi:hypothetical protein